MRPSGGVVRRNRRRDGQALLAAGLFVAGAATLVAAVAVAGQRAAPPGNLPVGAATSPTVPEEGSKTSSTASRPPGQTHGGNMAIDSPPKVVHPVTVQIPAIDVEAELIALDLDEYRRLEVPDDPAKAGWYVRGPRPGEDGPAVIVGHVDSRAGPAVFWRLAEVADGDRITVHDAHGTRQVFVVNRVERWPKNDFPTDEVYRRSDGPELRLITCGGDFDRAAGSYRDNVIVFATATPTSNG